MDNILKGEVVYMGTGPKSRLNDHHGPTARSTEIVGNNVLFFFFLSPSLLLSFSSFPFGPAGRKILEVCPRGVET